MITLKEAEKVAEEYGYKLVRKIPKRIHCICGGKQIGLIETNIFINYNGNERVCSGWKCFCRKCGIEGTPSRTQRIAMENWNHEITYGWEV